MVNSNMAPKFSKVELLIKDTKGSDLLGSTTKIEFDDCGLMITGDYLVIIIDERNELNGTLTSTGKIFEMKTIQAYKTHSF
jgi:hypothetical protein